MLVLGSVSPKLGVFNFTELGGFQKETPSPNEETITIHKTPQHFPTPELGLQLAGKTPRRFLSAKSRLSKVWLFVAPKI